MELDLFLMAYTVLGGLGIFILGMKFLSDGLQQLSGGLMRRLINRATSNRFLAVLVGIFITTLIQSSSITTVMVVGLVNAELMTLLQAVGVILGSNIGTTITGWILAVKIGKYGLLLVSLGIFPMLFGKNERTTSAGRVLVALGFIFFGLEIMSDAFKPLRSNPTFLSYLRYFTAQSLPSVLGCIVVGCILTMVVQGSSAMLGITIALATTGAIPFQTAVALVLGENIGTTITAQLAALGGTSAARRAAMAHTLFNVLGVTLTVLVFQPYVTLVDWLVPGDPAFRTGDGFPLLAAHIAMGHTLFNLSATILALPLLHQLVRLVTLLVPDTAEQKQGGLYYPEVAAGMPQALALELAESEIQKMSVQVRKSLKHSRTYLLRDGARRERFLEAVKKVEQDTDNVQREVTSFIVTAMRKGGSTEDSEQAYGLIRVADELETIADYANSLCNYRRRLDRYDLDFSEEAWRDIQNYSKEVLNFFNRVATMIATGSYTDREEVLEEQERLNHLADEVRHQHLQRMKAGICGALPALTFSDIIVALRRIKNHTVNLFEAAAFSAPEGEAGAREQQLAG